MVVVAAVVAAAAVAAAVVVAAVVVAAVVTDDTKDSGRQQFSSRSTNKRDLQVGGRKLQGLDPGASEEQAVTSEQFAKLFKEKDDAGEKSYARFQGFNPNQTKGIQANGCRIPLRSLLILKRCR